MKNQILSFNYLAILFIAVVVTSCSCNGKGGSVKTSNDSIDSAKYVADSLKKIEQAFPKYLVIQGTNVNLRVDPSLKADRIRQMTTGDTCEVIEKGNKDTVNDIADFWYKVKRKNKEGWVFGTFTSIKHPTTTGKQDKSKTLNFFLKSK